MSERVAIVGIGIVGIRPTSPEVSYRELIFQAAMKAYDDAGLDPRRDIQSFVSSSEDFLEGTSIFDSYVPDQLGAPLKPVCTVAADGMYALITAYMQIMSGLFEVVAVEAHSKASELVSPSSVMELALDPIFTRPLGVHPYFIAGLEMNRYLHESKVTRRHCALVVEKNRGNALANPYAAYGAKITAEDVVNSSPVAYPLTLLDISGYGDGAAVMVLASEGVARSLTDKPVWMDGVGWATDTPWLEARDWSAAEYAKLAVRDAYRRAGIADPRRQIDLAEVDDTFSYKELQHIEAAGLCDEGTVGRELEQRSFDADGPLPVNPSGGSLGVGHTFEMSGLVRVAEAAIQLRAEAGRRQVEGAKRALALSWRGIPTASGAAVVLSAG